MIISQIIGGLGNQMFQYAAARAVSLQKNIPLSLDVSKFPNYKLHQGFELHRIFNCPVKIVTELEMRRVLGWQYPALLQRILTRQEMSIFRGTGFIVEPGFEYWPGINVVEDDSYLSGYWQSEKYFQSEISTIRADFTFKQPLSNQNLVLAEKISGTNSVSLHIRRGDYVSNPSANSLHGLCSLEYYQAAIQNISKKISDPHFFIFSDDIEWSRQQLDIDFPCQYIDHNVGTESYCDMRLMSHCQHHIIANSTFSWWGAWLNSDPQKIVIAPVKWFADGRSVKDLYPAGWVLL